MSDSRRTSSPVPTAVSLAMNPSVWGGAFVAFVAWRLEPPGPGRWLAAGVGFLFVAVVPVGLLFALKAAGRLTDVEMRDRHERGMVYLACAFAYAVGAVVLYALRTTWPVWGLVALHAPTALALALLNRGSKISIHTAGLAGLAAAGLVLFGPSALPLLAAPIAGGWARWAAGAHTLAELAWGAVIGFLVTGGGMLGLRALEGGLP